MLHSVSLCIDAAENFVKIWTDKNYPIIISCAKELSRWTELEVVGMGYKPIEVTENTVVVRGSMRDMMRLNLN